MMGRDLVRAIASILMGSEVVLNEELIDASDVFALLSAIEDSTVGRIELDTRPTAVRLAGDGRIVVGTENGISIYEQGNTNKWREVTRVEVGPIHDIDLCCGKVAAVADGKALVLDWSGEVTLDVDVPRDVSDSIALLRDGLVVCGDECIFISGEQKELPIVTNIPAQSKGLAVFEHTLRGTFLYVADMGVVHALNLDNNEKHDIGLAEVLYDVIVEPEVAKFLKVDGGELYVVTNEHIYVFDVLRNPERPPLLRKRELEELPIAVAVNNGTVAIAERSGVDEFLELYIKAGRRMRKTMRLESWRSCRGEVVDIDLSGSLLGVAVGREENCVAVYDLHTISDVIEKYAEALIKGNEEEESED